MYAHLPPNFSMQLLCVMHVLESNMIDHMATES
jgi:hypothetical protein